MNKLILAALLCLGVNAAAQIVPAPSGSIDGNSYSGYLANEYGLAYDKKYVIDLAPYDASKISAQVIYGSQTFPAATFTDGSESVGNITIASYALLSTAAATDNITVISTSNLAGAAITFGILPYQSVKTILTNGYDWNVGATKALTATSIAAALTANVPNVSFIASGSVIYATATAGAFANSYTFKSNNSSITVNALAMTGGQDAATLTIGSKVLTAGTDWADGSSNANTATSIAAAITAAGLGLKAIGSGAIVFATSTLNGTAYNYALVSSSQVAMALSSAAMSGGTDPSFVLKGSAIGMTTSSFTLALPLLYTANSASIGGLTNQTTYYATQIGTNQISLSTTSARAVLGLPLIFTSTTSQTSAHSPSLTPLAIAGSPSITWQSSNDGVNYNTAASTGAVSMSTTSGTTSLLYDAGVYNFRYIRATVTAPTAGGMLLQIPVNIKQDGIGRF